MQRWLLLATTLILGALAYQNQQITGVLIEMRAVTDAVSSNGRRIERLESWRYSVPFRAPDIVEMPKVALPLDPRRRLHLADPDCKINCVRF